MNKKITIKRINPWKFLQIMFILAILFLIGWSFVHETAHYTACNLIGLNSKITVDLFQNPPLFQASCEGINERSILSKFFFLGAPYMFSCIVILCFLLFWKKKTLYSITFPFAILMSDMFNLWGFYTFNSTYDFRNDLVQIVFKSGKPYLYLLLVILSVSIVSFIFIFRRAINLIAQNQR